MIKCITVMNRFWNDKFYRDYLNVLLTKLFVKGKAYL